MARKITTDAINAFMLGNEFKRDNTEVTVQAFAGTTNLYLHGNLIARRYTDNGNIHVTNANWQSNTTKERLNGIPGVSIVQRKGIWLLNGNEWNGDWIKV